jgi:hypothetical protein
VAVGAKDAKPQEVIKGLLQQRPLLICPKVSLQHMFQYSGILELNDSSKLRDRKGPGRSIFLMHTLALLRDLVARGESHEEHVSNQGVATGTLEVGAGLDAIGGIAVLEDDGEDIDDKYTGEVSAGELVQDFFECWRCV